MSTSWDTDFKARLLIRFPRAVFWAVWKEGTTACLKKRTKKRQYFGLDGRKGSTDCLKTREKKKEKEKEMSTVERTNLQMGLEPTLERVERDKLLYLEGN